MIAPGSEADLAEVVAGGTGPLVIAGGGTRSIGAAQGEVLQVTGISGVSLYEPAALTLVVKAGTPLAEIEALLAGERQRLGFEPPDLSAVLGRRGQSTIGGVVGANAAGPRAVQVGYCRDALLGVRFVDGRGVAISSGGQVMKNVTGYDLVKLMAGSFGSLGVLTEVSLKVQSMPETEATLVYEGLDDAAGLSLLRRAQVSPCDISGAARVAGRSYVRLEGMAGSVAYRVAKLRGLGDAHLAEGAASAALWRDLRDLAALRGRVGDLWRIATLPTLAAAVARDVAHRCEAALVFDHGGAVIWALVPADTGTLVRAALDGRGQAIKVRGSGACPFAPQSAEVAALSAAIKAQFDPGGRFAMQAVAADGVPAHAS